MPGKSTRTVEVFFSPANLDELYLRGKNVVVVDVLRASTTVAVALQNGAKEIIPVASVESAVKISGSLFGDVTLRGGERNGKIITGFNLGNSPLEYTEQVVKSKSIIYTTTNGSSAMVRGRYAARLVLGGFVNISKLVAYLKSLKEDFVILCAGSENDFCLEDAVCAGMILGKMFPAGRGVLLDDGGKAAMLLYKSYGKDILRMLRDSDHGRFLIDIGFEKDLEICAAIDSIPLIPALSGNVIKPLKESAQELVSE